MENLWSIDGRYYDFSRFVDKHPGGSSFILLGRGRDCSELFHSVHQLSNTNFKLLFQKYEITDKNLHVHRNKTLFKWDKEKAPFYTELNSRVRKMFSDSKQSRKGNWFYWVCVWLNLLVCLYLCYCWVTGVLGMVTAPLCGVFTLFYGFFLMHTASHGGCSEIAWINWVGYSTFCNLTGWIHFFWLQHHVFGHHSFTGMYGLDPDLRNMNPFARKSNLQKPTSMSKYQGYSEIPVMTLFPNQFLGQLISYFSAIPRGKLFGMPLTVYYSLLDNLACLVMLGVWFYCIIYLPIYYQGLKGLFLIGLYYSACGTTYWAIVFPNHDIEEVYQNSLKLNSKYTHDWSVHQIVHSSNFKCSASLSYWMGGMNYQIEHHLFPSVHPRHHAAISKIVQELCLEHDIPYVVHDSWLQSFYSHIKFMNLFTKDGKQD